MKKVFSLVSLLFFALVSFGQILEPVHWDFETKQVNGNEFDLIFTAKIDDGWTIYSQFLEGDDGPVPTAFYFDEKEKHYTKTGKVEESPENRKTVHDNVFDMELTKFSKKATFTQRVKVTEGKPITGWLEFMTCDASRCLPPAEVDFSFAINLSATTAETTSASAAEKKTSQPSKQVETGLVANQTVEKSDVQAAEGGNTDEAPANDGILEPVAWSFEIQPQDNGTHAIALKAKIDEGWYVYSQFVEEDGPEPTSVEFDEDPNLEVLGKAEEVSDHKVEGFDKVFEMDVTKFKKEVTFLQKVKVADATKPVNGLVYFMTCDDSRCLPPTEVFFTANLSTGEVTDGAEEVADAGTSGGIPPVINDGGTVIDKSIAVSCNHTIETKNKSLWGTFLLGIIGGLLALLTPCVWPMIPLTVSFFTKGAENKRKGLFNAFMYGFYILLVYLLLSAPFHLLDSINPDILNEISTNVWLNLFFFAIFIFFAFSFFGYYEITLPSSWLNKSSSAEGIGGAVGIFFMALTLALVSFSCTGPILGSLLAGTLSSNAGGDPATLLTAGMAGFGFALALPFGLFAAFPSWLNTLPKSGGWMTTVKVVLGFLELALALKFLSNADLVKHWGLLKIEPFLALWIVIFILLGIYLFGKIRFPHDAPLKKVPIPRAVLGIASFAFAIYLMTGFKYDERAGSLKPLTLLSGLAPPACYSWLYECDCPQNLSCFKDFEEGMAYAKKVNKPVMIDFTGHACVNCRKMEETVWPRPEVYKILNKEYVLISLYVDEKIELPEEEQVTVELKSGKTRKLRYTGHRWQILQTENFNINSQPYYVLLAPDGKMLNNPVPYTPDVQEYASFLECGLNHFKELDAENKLLGDNQQ
ncbi:MAG: protein-disulfide reductase DsbD domain-containing protein [Bacteroidota bacterium]